MIETLFKILKKKVIEYQMPEIYQFSLILIGGLLLLLYPATVREGFIWYPFSALWGNIIP